MPNKRKRELSDMEHEEAPSGFVHLYNVKLPLMKFTEGFGFQGVLLMDGKTDKVQCHFCGLWLNYLPYHLRKEHNMSAADYKTRVGLRQNTALISESARENLIRSGLEKRLQNLKVHGKHTEEAKNKISETMLKVTREQQNQRGTCPEQLLENLRNYFAEHNGHPPLHSVPQKETLAKVFGSLEVAYRRAGVTPGKVGVNHRWLEITDDVLLNDLRDFHKRYDRWPSTSDFKRGLIPHSFSTYYKHFHSWKKTLYAARMPQVQ